MPVRSIAAAFAICVVAPAIRADENDFNPYRTAKVGDFATYKMKVTFGPTDFTSTTTKTITEKTDNKATIRETTKEVTIKINGMVHQPMDRMEKTETKTIHLMLAYDHTEVGGVGPGFQSDVTKDKEGKEKIKVLGKEYDSTWISYTIKPKSSNLGFDGNLKIWLSKDIPLGVLKVETTGKSLSIETKMQMEVSEAGTKK